MRILILIDVIDSGGVSSVLRSILNHIDLDRYHIDVLTFEKNDEYDSTIPEKVRIRHVYKRNPAKSANRFVRYMYGVAKEYAPKWIIRRILKMYDYDVVIDFKGNNLNVLVAANCTKVFWSHKDFSPETNPIERNVILHYSKTKSGAYKEKAFRKHLKSIDRIVCISESCRKGFVSRWGEADKISVIYNVIDPQVIIDKANEVINYSKPEYITFVCMTRICAGKGIERLLRCTERLNTDGYVFSLNIIGGGDTYEEMEKLGKEMRLTNVQFFGHKHNPYPYVRLSDVFVYPSETEAYSTALCEGLIIGKPVITARTCSVEEILEKGRYGVIVDNTDEGIYSAMKLFLDNPTLVRKYEELSIKRRGCFNLSARIKEIEDYFNEIERDS